MTFHRVKGKRLRDCGRRMHPLTIVVDHATWCAVRNMSEAENVPASAIVRRGLLELLARIPDHENAGAIPAR